MNKLPEIFNQFLLDTKLLSTERDKWWEKKYKPKLESSVNKTIKDLGLDMPWEKIHEDPLKEALAEMLFTSVLSCYGPKISAETLHELNVLRFGGGTSTDLLGSPIFTANHKAVPVKMISLDSRGEQIGKESPPHNMPAFSTEVGGKSTLGDISPISIIKTKDNFELQLKTSGGHVWRKKIEVIKAPEYSKELVGREGYKIPAGLISMPCASGFSILNIRNVCQENCAFCSMLKAKEGEGKLTKIRKQQVSETIGLIVEDAFEKSLIKNKRLPIVIQQTLSGGSLDTGDGGFEEAYGWALSEFQTKIAKAKEKYKNTKDVRVQLQIEMILPPDKSTWEQVIKKLNDYRKLTGWTLSLAINTEVLPDEYEAIFLDGKKAKGVSKLRDHIEFARELSEGTEGKVKMNSLVLFGLKPVWMPYHNYMAKDLRLLKELMDEGLYMEYAPVKIEPESTLAAYPPTDPIFFMIQYLVFRKMVSKTKRVFSPGCEGACSRCHNIIETHKFINLTKDYTLPQLLTLFKPVLDKLGRKYKKMFIEVFSQIKV